MEMKELLLTEIVLLVLAGVWAVVLVRAGRFSTAGGGAPAAASATDTLSTHPRGCLPVWSESRHGRSSVYRRRSSVPNNSREAAVRRRIFGC